jgi:hypothetical protein
MTNKELHLRINERLKEFSAENSFSKRDKYTLIKKQKSKEITQFISIGTASYGLVHRISYPHAIVSFVELERLLEPFNEDLFFGSNPPSQKPFINSISNHLRYENTPKIIRDVGDDDGLNLKIKNIEGLELGLDLLLKTIKEKVIPFFDEVNSLEGFNLYLEKLNWISNTNPKETDPFVMIKWLLVKKLIKCTNYNQLKENRLILLNNALEEDRDKYIRYYESYLKYFDFLETI